MERAVVTACIGDLYGKIFNVTQPLLKSYADSIGAEFVVLRETGYELPASAIFGLFDLLVKYKRVIFLHADCLVRRDCPDLFEEVAPDQLGVFDEGQFTDKTPMIREACTTYKRDLPSWGGKYYNFGVVVASRKHRFLFEQPEHLPEADDWDPISAYLNLQVLEGDTEIHELPYKFNRMSLVDDFTGEDRHASYIIHYAGPRDKHVVLPILEKDRKLWSEDFRGKKHIVVQVSGGLGDQICAEPVIRWMREKIYPHDEILLTSDWPRIFRHLEGSVVDGNFNHKEARAEADTPYFRMNTLPKPDTMIWQILSHAMCHPVDFASIACLRRTLPEDRKQPQIQVDAEDIQKLVSLVGLRPLDELLLVHPGRHWPSKTFPKDWWQAIVESLHQEGIPLAVIGKEVSDTQGYVDIECPEGVIDLRDLLDLGSFITIISQGKVLISNDSAPIHIAGAFDNSILLIPSVKHPDHVLPYRNGSKYYKAAALYKMLVCDAYDTSPTQVHGQTLEQVPGDVLDFIPDPGEVVKVALAMYREKS